ncbi:MAG: hypothetical protein M0P49_00620 [Bacilli bacterium]|nr:hypothetical protein [Bacilli bacterium]
MIDILKLKQYFCNHKFGLIATHKTSSQNLWQCPKCGVFYIQHWGIGIGYKIKTPNLDNWVKGDEKMSDYNRYFMYSREQLRVKKAIEAKIGRTFIPGTVIVNGSKKQYTEMSTSPNATRFYDSVVVMNGDIRGIVYTDPKVE